MPPKKRRSSKAVPSDDDREFAVKEILCHSKIGLLKNQEHLHVYGMDTIAFKVRWEGFSREYDSWEPLINICRVVPLVAYVNKHLVPMVGYVSHFDGRLKEVISYEFIEPTAPVCEPGYYLKDLAREVDEFEPQMRISPLPRKGKKELPPKKRRRAPNRYHKFVPSRDGLECFDVERASDDDDLYEESEILMPSSSNITDDAVGTLLPFELENAAENMDQNEEMTVIQSLATTELPFADRPPEEEPFNADSDNVNFFL